MTRALVTQLSDALDKCTAWPGAHDECSAAITAAREYLATEQKPTLKETLAQQGIKLRTEFEPKQRDHIEASLGMVGERAELIDRLAKQWAELDPADPYRADIGKAADMLEADGVIERHADETSVEYWKSYARSQEHSHRLLMVELKKLRADKREPKFHRHEVESESAWTEWVCPDPEKYLMKCCDCGLVHEMQFKVVKYSDDDECEHVNDPNTQAVFRARRVEAQQATDPVCPSCQSPGLLYECVHCSANSYPEDFAQQTKSKDAELIATYAKLAEAELRANQLESQFKSQCRITASALDERAQQAKRVPLAGDEIEKIADGCRAGAGSVWPHAFARALEAHHKILPAQKPTDWSAA